MYPDIKIELISLYSFKSNTTYIIQCKHNILVSLDVLVI